MDKVKAAVVTISDTRIPENDISGNELVRVLDEAGIDAAIRRSSTDDKDSIISLLTSLCEREDIDMVFTTGGTGLSPRDNTPEATLAVIEREVPGLAEAMRRETSASTALAILSRGVCGIRGSVLIVNMPGSPKAVKECVEVIRPVLSHAAALLRGGQPH